MTLAIRLCNIYNLSKAKLTMRKYHYITLYVECLFISMLITLLLMSISLSIAVHIRSVFCVPCTSCDNVQHALILPPLPVTPLQFDMRYHFTTGTLRTQYQYTCKNRCRTHVCMWTYRAHALHTCILYVCP